MLHLSRAISLSLLALALTACGGSPQVSALPIHSAIPLSPTPLAHPAIPRPTRPPTPTPAPINPTPTLAPLGAQARTRIFGQVWETVRDHYLYEDYGGVDWPAIYDEYAPYVDKATAPEEFYALMREMIDRLGDDHSRFESPQEVAEQEAEFAGTLRYGGIGAEIRDVEDGGLVTSVVPGGPADRVGLKPRDLIAAINGVSYLDSSAFGPDGPIGQVRGEPGTTVRLSIRSPGQALREVVLVRQVIDIDAFNRVSTERLANGTIGLISIPSFYVENVDIHVQDAITRLLAEGPLQGLLIDVRTNAGGYVHLMRNTIALFHDGGSIGSTRGRNTNELLRIPSGKSIPALNNLPIVVLISPETVSAAEMFAAGMRAIERAKVVGTPSAGNTENLYAYNFPDGSRILLAEVAYHLPDGSMIEGHGVIPDRSVDAEWWRYAPADDPQIIAAIEELRTSSYQSKPQQ